jgi:hypothetical protein
MPRISGVGSGRSRLKRSQLQSEPARWGKSVKDAGAWLESTMA